MLKTTYEPKNNVYVGDGSLQPSSVVESGVLLVTFNEQSVNCTTLRMILSLFVDTSLLKTFRFVKNTVPGTGTRLHFRCLDASGSLLTEESVPVTAGDAWEYNRYIVSSNEPYLYTYYGGTYTKANDSALTDIRVHPDVKTIQLLVAMKQLISFQNYGIGTTGPELCRIWTNPTTTGPTPQQLQRWANTARAPFCTTTTARPAITRDGFA